MSHTPITKRFIVLTHYGPPDFIENWMQFDTAENANDFIQAELLKEPSAKMYVARIEGVFETETVVRRYDIKERDPIPAGVGSA